MPLNTWRVGLGLTHHLGSLSFDGEFDLRGYSSQYLRGDESNRHPQLPGHRVASLRGQLAFSRFRVAFEIENLFNTAYNTFGIEATTGLFPPGSHIALDDDSAPFENFLTPGLPRHFVVTVSAGL
jgi:outer membrane receptor protein involved in Fe transport